MFSWHTYEKYVRETILQTTDMFISEELYCFSRIWFYVNTNVSAAKKYTIHGLSTLNQA
jgi:hypothetical protein